MLKRFTFTIGNTENEETYKKVVEYTTEFADAIAENYKQLMHNATTEVLFCLDDTERIVDVKYEEI